MTERFTISNLDPAVLTAESERVQQLLAAAVPKTYILEVGSTAVPGVIGKQDIDILVRVPQAEFNTLRAKLDNLLLRNPNQLSNAIYQGYLVVSELDVAVQLTIANGPNDNFLEFMQRLRTQPKLVEEYNALKRKYDGQPMDAYREAKQAFIQAALA